MAGESERPVSASLAHDQSAGDRVPMVASNDGIAAGAGLHTAVQGAPAIPCASQVPQSAISFMDTALEPSCVAAMSRGTAVPCVAARANTTSQMALRTRLIGDRFIALNDIS